MTDTEIMIDIVFGIVGTFHSKGEIDNEKKTCRPVYKPANCPLSLLGRTKRYPIDIPLNCLIRCDMNAKYKGQFQTYWVIMPWDGCKEISMNDTVFGQLGRSMDDEVEKLRSAVQLHDQDMYVLEEKIKTLQAEKLQGRVRAGRLKCSKDICNETFTRTEAEDNGYVCPECNSPINSE